MENKIPLSPSLTPVLAQERISSRGKPIDSRSVMITCVACGLGIVATVIAVTLTRLIGLVTNIAFFHRLSTQFIDPGQAPDWGLWVIGVPVLGGVLVGLMARYGSKAIRGHGIPEAMEQILTNESRIPWSIIFLKPISAAIAIGTGGPFGAEGPIIATGGALGSWIGQILQTTASERKTLLAAGAAAGMTATFGSPISAVLLAVELLLFEFKPRSLIPVALAAVSANAARIAFLGIKPAFEMPIVESLGSNAVIWYGLMGVVIGLCAVLVTHSVYWVEDLFEKLPIHWMWWPAIGGLAVGVVGYFSPRTLGVGYANIEDILGGGFFGPAMALFCLLKFVSWAIALGSGTSGGTLAPIFTIGGGLGAGLGYLGQSLFPTAGIDLRLAALVGMAGLFAGASRALLASVVFAFETTRQPFGLLPLLAGCSVSYLISGYLMRNTIMTEKIVRRGVRVPHDYAPDFLTQVKVDDICSKVVVFLLGTQTAGDILAKMIGGLSGYSHQGFPVLSEKGDLLGVITRRDLMAAKPNDLLSSIIKRPAHTIFADDTLREAADLMSTFAIGRLPVVLRSEPGKPVGMVTRSDLLKAHLTRIRQEAETTGRISLPGRPKSLGST